MHRFLGKMDHSLNIFIQMIHGPESLVSNNLCNIIDVGKSNKIVNNNNYILPCIAFIEAYAIPGIVFILISN